MKNNTVKIKDILIGNGQPLVLISGPCVIENEDATFETAKTLKKIADSLGMPFIFKASYDKANRTSINSYRGPGLKKGLAVLKSIKNKLGVILISDVHSIDEVEEAAQVLDVIQIPALLCRQTDLIVAAAKTGKPINIKKGQFLAPWDIVNSVEKAVSTGNTNILITERGAMFGYNNLIADFRSIMIMQNSTGCPVIFDATHSVQLPGGSGSVSGGQREFAPVLARAAVAAGADGIFLEVHKEPDKALCDGPNSIQIDKLYALLSTLKAIKNALEAGS